MRLSSTQKVAVTRGSDERWLGAKQNGVVGNTMRALEDRELAEVRIVKRDGKTLAEDQVWVGSNTMQYRLTELGQEWKEKIVASA